MLMIVSLIFLASVLTWWKWSGSGLLGAGIFFGSVTLSAGVGKHWIGSLGLNLKRND